MWWIYALADPLIPEHIRYVGKTERGLKYRYAQHISNGRKGQSRYPVLRWLNKIILAGRMPVMALIETSRPGFDTLADCNDRETALIAHYRSLGHILLNVTKGGDGQCGVKQSPEQIARLIARQTGVPLTEEHRRNIGLGNKGRIPTPETRQRIAKTLTGFKHSEEAKANMAKGHIGQKPFSRERNEKISKTLSGRTLPRESVEKMRVALQGKQRSGLSILKGKATGHHARLNYEVACEIRMRRSTDNLSISKLAIEYNVSHSSILAILQGRSYKDSRYSQITLDFQSGPTSSFSHCAR